MKKSLALLAAAALVASTSGAFAGGLNAAIGEKTVVKGGPASVVPVWAFLPLGACLVACFQDGGDTEGTSATGPTGG